MADAEPANKRPRIDRPAGGSRGVSPRIPVLARNRRVLDDWLILERTRLGPLQRCWDHIATQPTTPFGSRYQRLRGPQAYVDLQGQRLPQWQWEVDRGARVKVAVAPDYVVVISVSSGHPKENE